MNKFGILMAFSVSLILLSNFCLANRPPGENPQIMHNPPLQICSSNDFKIIATINNLDKGIPVVNYHYEGEKQYVRRAMRELSSGRYEFTIMAAALTGRCIDYYFEVLDGANVATSLGSPARPLQAIIVGPQYNKTVVSLALILAIVGAFKKLGEVSNKKRIRHSRNDPHKGNTPGARKPKHDKLSAKIR